MIFILKPTKQQIKDSFKFETSAEIYCAIGWKRLLEKENAGY